MFRSIQEITDYTVLDLNNESVGTVSDFYIDDVTWVVRYLVVDTGVWLPGRLVLISPASVGEPDWGHGVALPVSLSKKQIENSPPISADKPVSRQQEIELADYFQWPAYWNDVTFFDAQAVGMAPNDYIESRRALAQAETAQRREVIEQAVAREETGDPHLRSVNEINGYYIKAADDDIGHVEDFIVDTESWTIRYMVIDTRNWLPGKKVVISPLWVHHIEWRSTEVYVDLPREKIENSPEFDPATPVNRAYEERLFDYYGRPKYWY